MERVYDKGQIHDSERLKELQSLPLDRKIGITVARVSEFIKEFGEDRVYVSVSGGKDSTVLWDIVHKLYPDVPAVFSDTGLEYPEVRKFAMNIATEIVKPKLNFVNVIKKYGYPVISKEVSGCIYYARKIPRSQFVNVERESKNRTAIWSRLELEGERPQISHAEYFNQIAESRGSVHVPQKNIRRKALLGTYATGDGSKKSVFNKEKWLHWHNFRSAFPINVVTQ